MAESLEADAVVVGAGTSGGYFAWKLAEAGFRCLVVEGKSLDQLGEDIGPFHIEKVGFERSGIPLPSGEELLHALEYITMWSPSGEHGITSRVPTMNMYKPLFMRRLHGYAREAGVEFLERTEFLEVIREGGFPGGLRARGENGDLEIRSHLVVDASGIDGRVRTSMPSSPWLENDPVHDLDTLVVYMESWRDIVGDIEPDINSYLHAQGWYAPSVGEEIIVGIGCPASPDAARNRHKAFAATLPFAGEASSVTIGRVPYRRPPYSLVDNGFMVVGDAAFMSKPFNGEGVVSALTACRIAAEVAADALSRDDLSKEALWPYNLRYFRDQGSKFAFLMAVIPCLASLGEDEIEYLFTVPGLLTAEGTQVLNLEYELVSNPADALRVLLGIARGVVGGKLSPRKLASIAEVGIAAARLKGFYERYPEHPVEFGGWLRKVEPLWRGADEVKHDFMTGVMRECTQAKGG
ncbi:MAG: NAD(P)/FAD-dependent oxidoreductase [Actinomycetota bacterium]|nr:NAD(P)/FAD-dependent oxidoreductase [Actinomycetota bacterium]